MANSIQKVNTLTWRQESANATTSSYTADVGQLSYQSDYTGGNASLTGTFNELYHITGRMSSGGTGNYNLQSIPQSIFGYQVNKTFVNVRTFDIKNNSTASGANLYLNVTSSSGFKEPFGYPTGQIRIGPKSVLSVNDFFRGWDVDTNNRHIRLVDGGSGVSYEMVIVGCSG